MIIIKNGRVIDPANNIDKTADIVINDGIITFVGDSSQYAFVGTRRAVSVLHGDCDIYAGTARRAPTDKNNSLIQIIDASGLIVAPGLVDMHVHLRDPGQTHKEDIISGCRAAAAGGVTSLLCMPNTSPAIDCADTVKYVAEKAKNADARVYIAGAVTTGLAGLNPADFAGLKSAGAIAITDDGVPVWDDKILRAVLSDSKGLAVLCHGEVRNKSQGGIMRGKKIPAELGVVGIPADVEWHDVLRTIRFAEELGAAVHICHVSTKTSLDRIREAKKRGVRVTCETAPHYCAFTLNKLKSRDADYRMNPPLGSSFDLGAVRKALNDGTIDCIATDHAPHSPDEKSDFMAAPNGVIGMETSLSAMLTYTNLNISDIINLMSYSPAKILGIPAGTLSIGAPADICIFDPNKEWTIDVNNLHGKSKNAVFKGCRLTGKVVRTILGGRTVYQIDN